MADVGGLGLQHLTEPMAVLAVTVGHHGHGGAVDQRVQVERVVEVGEDHCVCLREALRSGKVAATVDDADMPVQQFRHAHQRLRVVTGAENHQARWWSDVFEEHFDFAAGIGVEAQR
ncbi:hypothetical protein D3C76_1309080 [compost metagenome]